MTKPKGRPTGSEHKNPLTTDKQKATVDNVLSGKSKSLKSAMLAGGYSPMSASCPGKNFLQRKGVRRYLKTLNRLALEKFGIGVRDKLALTYVEGLEATKLYGAEALEAPDWGSRHKFAESIAKFLNLVEQSNEGKSVQANQFNFFSSTPEEKAQMNKNFADFLRKFYASNKIEDQEPVE